ncbi:pyridoxal phosphate-dependent transferase [Aspergillus heterothallicus]
MPETPTDSSSPTSPRTSIESTADKDAFGEAFSALPKEIWAAIYDIHTQLTTALRDPSTRIIDQSNLATLSHLRASSTPTQNPQPLSSVLTQAQKIFSLRSVVNHPRFLAYIPLPVSPVSFLGDVLTSCFNVFAGSREAAAGVCAIEDALIAWLAEQVGFPTSAGGLFVSGGSMANLTALALAREKMLPMGNANRSKGIVYITDQTHFCIVKALKILGFDVQRQVRVIACDDNFRMDVVDLERAIIQDTNDRLTPFLIIATCGTTNTGAVDPLHAIADVAKNYRLWLHVDGSFGASAALSGSHRSLVAGLGRADSLAWDAHKWLFQTYGCGVVLVGERAHLRESFAEEVEFLDEGREEDSWKYGIELSRPARHMRLWVSLKVLGTETVGRMIDRGVELGEIAARMVEGMKGWEVVEKPGMAILNMRYVGTGTSHWSKRELEMINKGVPGKLMERNVAFVGTACLRGKVGVRLCVINPLTTEEDLRVVLEGMDKAAHEIEASIIND